jgi:prepilin-type N-terminal cleavage/methylation domain-containing protein
MSSRRVTILSRGGRYPASAAVRTRQGYTLIELVLAMIVAGLLMAGMASALVVAGRAADTATGDAEAVVDSRQALDRIAADLNHATGFVSHTTTSVTFTVPDRDGNNTAETISYSWSGTAGDPLTREYNNSGPKTIATGVESFNLIYLAKPLFTPLLQQSAVMDLYSYEATPLSGYAVSTATWCAQFVRPALPTNAVSWSVTEVRFLASRLATGQTLKVDVEIATTRQRPANQAVEPKSVSSTTLSSPNAGYVTLAFSTISSLDPTAGVCVTVKQLTGTQAANIMYASNVANMPRDSHFLTSSGNTTWSTPIMTRDMALRIRGAVVTQGTPEWP